MSASPLGGLVGTMLRMGRWRPSLVFLRGLLEFWWDSTGTFHFPWGEMAVTPFDFAMITGLHFGGRPVREVPHDREEHRSMEQRLTPIVGETLARRLGVYVHVAPYSVLADHVSR